MTSPNTGRFPDCPDCEGRGGYPCPSCDRGSADCEVCSGTDWTACDACEALSSLLAAVALGEGVRRFTSARVRNAHDREYLHDGALTWKGRRAVTR